LRRRIIHRLIFSAVRVDVTEEEIYKGHYYSDALTSFDGINNRQAHKAATNTGYSGHNNADIAGEWFKLG
jgi:hypothetical protein